MNETIILIAAFAAGVGLGTLFFSVLWYTVKKAMKAKLPWLWVLGSFVFRVAIVLVAFYFIGAGNWQRLVVCLVGFVIARFIVIHFTKAIDDRQSHIVKEVAHGT